MGFFENGARAGKAKASVVEGHRGRDFRGHGRVGRRAEGATEVAHVAAHEDERRRRGASKAGDMTDGMTRDIEDVEAAVAEEVIGGVLADFGGGGVEGDLVDCAASALVKIWKRHPAPGAEAYSKSDSSMGESFLPG